MRDPVATSPIGGKVVVSCVVCPAVRSLPLCSVLLSRGRKPLAEMCSLGSTDLTNINQKRLPDLEGL